VVYPRANTLGLTFAGFVSRTAFMGSH
jgi:hypothetical protein